ncbi:thioredoxin family protein, partial [Erwinia amylovora]|uniref:thioredoxin family protein n=1 Tax=Erwinia amylovora TaxID=552 RepID=UPI0020BFF229
NEKMLRYTAQNVERIDHILKTINIESKLYNALSSVTHDMICLVLSEPWCGDASQVVPVLYSIAYCTDHISFRIIQSDAHPEIL